MIHPTYCGSHRQVRSSLRVLTGFILTLLWTAAFAASEPTRAANGMVVSADRLASEVGVEVLEEGGNAIDAAIATAFALAVTHPGAGNIGGGGFLLHQPRSGKPIAYDFREVAPAAAHPRMWLDDGEYSYHHAFAPWTAQPIQGAQRNEPAHQNQR